MKFSEQWLREWVNPTIDTNALAHKLTMAGLEVDGIEPAAKSFTKIVVGEVLETAKHPEADRLTLCKVNVGDAEALNIVCGASNVKPGIKVPTALVGAVLPGDFKIKKSKLRGQPSHGMLCSETEIDLAEQADGLMILPADAPIGMDVREYLQLNDQVIDVDFTPNRGDCLSIAGMAREVAVLTDSPLSEPEIEKITPTSDDRFEIKIEAEADCPRYQGRVILNLNPAAQTPLWMQERLRRAGLRSLGPVVDVTNYVLLEYGQPMHAFDLEKLDSSIIVRRAKAKEKIKLLDDSEIELNPDMLVIADKKQAVAFAGIMGGAATAVNDSTKHIFLECAFFNPDAIRGKARHYGMQTDSSYRFERGVDFHLQSKAMERATGLIQAICGGEVGPISESCSEKHLPKRVAIQLRLDRITRILGIEIDPKEINNILTKLGMKLESNKTTWAVTPPSHRFDIAIEADLIEEVGRIYGYDNIPSHIPHCDLRMAPQPEAKTTIERVREVLVDRGYQEAITYSFVDPESHQLVDPKTEALQLSNPISADMSVMRTSLWSSLLKALVYNQARQQQRIRLFEVGKTFIKSSDKLLQQTRIAAVAYGSTNPIGWGEINKATDFFDIKGDLEAILGLTSSSEDFIFKAAQHPALHPGQSAEICRDGVNIGWIGALHPQIQKKLDLPGSAIVFEIAYEGLEQGMINTFSPVSKFPSIRRDLALVVDENITAKAICDQVGQIGKERLKSLDIFDVYRGQGIAEGKKSIAITLTLQDDQQTLTDVEVDNLVTDILASLQKTTGATLRE